MIKAYRLRNALLIGQFNGGSLDSLLQNTVYKSASQIMFADRAWAWDISRSETAMAAVLASETAMAAVAASETAMAAVLASETAMAAVAASETAMAAVAASETAMAAVAASETAMAAVNDSSIAKNAFFNSPKKMSVTCTPSNWFLVASGSGVFVRFKGTQYSSNKLKIDNTKDIAIPTADFFKIIPYASKLDVLCYHTNTTVHFIRFGV